ncbi:MAG: hypothetical protein ABFD25_07890 [Clostridiaceae bacterium]
MPHAAQNLKTVMGYFSITNSELSRALAVDPSLISRWLNGQRKLNAASISMDALAEFILSKSKRVHDIEWLKAQFEKDGLPTDLSTVYRIKQNLIMWLASDGEALRHNLGKTPSMPCFQKNVIKTPAHSAIYTEGAVKIGCLELALGLTPLLSVLPGGSGVDIFLSNDEVMTIVAEDFSRLLLQTIGEKQLKVRLLICISGNTQAMSQIIDTYMQPLVSGYIRLSLVHGMTQTVTNQMHLIIPGKYSVLVTEAPKAAAPPVATIVSEETFVKEMQSSFERAIRYAQPVLNIYDDNYSRNILEILYAEFAAPGNLDIVKDNINPMYMTADDYDRFLRTHGYSEAEFAWRSAEFKRFKTGMDDTLKGGAVFREILSLRRLNQIAQDGCCRMPGLYFMKKGFVKLDKEGCAAILNGYIRCLETVPNFHVLILDDITMMHTDNCWQLKQNHHLAINHWSGGEPVMIHCDQLMILREFQAYFDNLWAQGSGSPGNRNNVIDILRNLSERMENSKR